MSRSTEIALKYLGGLRDAMRQQNTERLVKPPKEEVATEEAPEEIDEGELEALLEAPSGENEMGEEGDAPDQAQEGDAPKTFNAKAKRSILTNRRMPGA